MNDPRSGPPKCRVLLGKLPDEGHPVGEVRSHVEGDERFIRTLFAMPSNESWCAFLVMGDKNSSAIEARTGNDWYDTAITLADALWREIPGHVVDRVVVAEDFSSG